MAKMKKVDISKLPIIRHGSVFDFANSIEFELTVQQTLGIIDDIKDRRRLRENDDFAINGIYTPKIAFSYQSNLMGGVSRKRQTH
jgi:hypothetical protein